MINILKVMFSIFPPGFDKILFGFLAFIIGTLAVLMIRFVISLLPW